MVDRLVLIKAGKVLTLVFGVVGLHSHFQSKWVKSVEFHVWDDGHKFDLKAYKLCPVKGFFEELRYSTCPSISMEQYFVSVIIITFFISLAIFVVGFITDVETGLLKHVDFGYHGISAILLFAAGVVYIISAVQIDKLVYGTLFKEHDGGLKFRKSEKIIDGVFTIFQSLLYGAIAVLIGMR